MLVFLLVSEKALGFFLPLEDVLMILVKLLPLLFSSIIIILFFSFCAHFF